MHEDESENKFTLFILTQRKVPSLSVSTSGQLASSEAAEWRMSRSY